MPKYTIEHETLHKDTDGWYAFRDLEGDGYGQYLFACFQYSKDDPKIYNRWINPVPHYNGGPIAEYFHSKQIAIKALGKVAGA